MSGSFAFILALFPLLSKVSAFGRCDSNIIFNIENSNLVAFPPPRFVLFENQRFSYDYAPYYDKFLIQSADIIFYNSIDNKVLTSTFNRYLHGSKCPTSVNITFFDNGDPYGVDFIGFIDSPTSNNRVYIWQVSGLVVAYYCSFDCPNIGDPLFVINTPINNCVITADQLSAAQSSINLVNNNNAVPLVRLRNPPTSTC